MLSGFAVLAYMALPLVAGAQERAAGGTLDVQMTWSALQAKVSDANAKSTAAHTRIDMIEACNKGRMLYAPKDTAADTNGCVPAVDPINMDSLSIFAVKGGFDAGYKMEFDFNLRTGKATVVDFKGFGKKYIEVPKLNYDLLCGGTKKYKFSLLSISQWQGMTLASGHRMDESIELSMPVYPTCANGMVGRAVIGDNTNRVENDNWSVGGVILMKAE